MRDLTSLEKSCIVQLISDDYSYENMISNEGIHPAEALKRFGWLMDSQLIAEGVWLSVVCGEYLETEESLERVETRNMRLCGKENIIAYAKALVEKFVPYANSKLSKKERTELFLDGWMFLENTGDEAEAVVNSIVD